MSATISARLVRFVLLAGTSFGLGLAPLWAQADDGEVDTVSQPVVQPLPGGPGMKLNSALGKLANNPRDVAALVEAGQASAAIGDAEAAMGFFRRADQLQPANANVKAGLAGAMVLAEDPFTAIPLFEEAERIGPVDPRLLADRGLAYDLVGDNELAQRYYRQALAAGPDDETIRRLALSLAISGDRRAMEVTLSPLLQKQDKAAWRTRAFAFAILGLASEAEAVARANLPEAAAGGMVAYLRYMPRLTRAQQAAAANLGHFPRAAEIGRDDPRIAAFVRPKASLAEAEKQASVPAASGRSDRPLRQRSRVIAPESSPVRASPAPAQVPVTASKPAIDPSPVGPGFAALDSVKAPVPGSDLAKAGAAAAPAMAKPAEAPLQPVPTSVAPVPAQTLALAPAPAPAQAPPQAPAQAPAPDPVAAKPAVVVQPPAPAVAKPRKLADVFADLAPPSREIEPLSGAVDLRRLTPARPKADDDAKVDPKTGKPKEPAKSPAASQPSRIWIQLAASRDKAGLAGDFRRFGRNDPELFKGRKAFTSPWGQATRLLTGPFPNEKAAASLLAQLKKAGMSDAFIWTSPAGQVVDPIAATK